jgi:hypothetical protein
MIVIKSIDEICDLFSLDRPEDEPVELGKAIQAQRLLINEDEKLCVKMKEPVETFTDGGESDTLVFRRASGFERKVLQNAPENKRGDAIQKCISHMCGIRLNQLERLDSSEVAILEEVFTLFL